MNALLNHHWRLFFVEYSAHLVRYVALAGFAYLLFYVAFRRKALARKIQHVFPNRVHIAREVLYSLLSLGIFSLVGVLTSILYKQGWIKLYLDINRYGWSYLWFSVVALILIHDTWFY